MATIYWPFPTSTVSEWPGQRQGSYHVGTDFAVPQGTPLRATADGVITRHNNDGLGAYVLDIITDDGLLVRNGHLSRMDVNTGQRVTAGQVIGLTGGARGTAGAGNSFGPHLHWELRRDRLWNGGAWIDPRNLNPKPLSFDGSTSTGQSISQEDDDDMLTMYRNKGDGMVIACSMATGYWWHVPDMNYLNLVKARGLVKNQDPIPLEPNEFGLLKQLLGEASNSLNRSGGGTATVDMGAIKTTIKESLATLNINVDGLAQAIADKINGGTSKPDITTKDEILAAIEANYPEGK